MSNLSGSVFICENFLPDSGHKQIQAYLQTLPLSQPSFVFNTQIQENELNSQVRHSKSIIVDDPNVLNFLKTTFLDQFATQHQNLVVKLARDHVTFIKYEPDGFFDWHRDHEKYIINHRERWIEAHLIYCLEAPESGGQLEIKRPESLVIDKVNTPISSDHEVLPIKYKTNQCVIFDKLLEHRALRVDSGYKIIMTIDVLISTQEIQSDPKLDFEILEARKNPKGLRSYKLDKIKAFKNSENILYGVLKIDNVILIYDTKGCYYRSDEDSSWIRQGGTFINLDSTDSRYGSGDPPHYLDSNLDYYLQDIMLSGDDVNIVQGDLQLPEFESKPIPEGIKPQTLLDEIPCCHVPVDLPEISYTYHCNEPSYSQYKIDHSFGLLNLTQDMKIKLASEEDENEEDEEDENEEDEEDEEELVINHLSME